MRVWPLWKLFQLVGGFISTHTPVRVWQTSGLKLPAEVNFNSHTREGVTMLPSSFVIIIVFQLTHPWGCDSFDNFCYRHLSYFNSHTREGVTIFLLLISYGIYISTHTPVRVWRHWSWPCKLACHFNSHTREGVTKNIFSASNTYHISTHTPVRVWHYITIL